MVQNIIYLVLMPVYISDHCSAKCENSVRCNESWMEVTEAGGGKKRLYQSETIGRAGEGRQRCSP